MNKRKNIQKKVKRYIFIGFKIENIIFWNGKLIWIHPRGLQGKLTQLVCNWKIVVEGNLSKKNQPNNTRELLRNWKNEFWVEFECLNSKPSVPAAHRIYSIHKQTPDKQTWPMFVVFVCKINIGFTSSNVLYMFVSIQSTSIICLPLLFASVPPSNWWNAEYTLLFVIALL